MGVGISTFSVFYDINFVPSITGKKVVVNLIISVFDDINFVPSITGIKVVVNLFICSVYMGSFSNFTDVILHVTPHVLMVLLFHLFCHTV